MIRVGVLGAAGRMGSLVCQAVAHDPDLALVAAVDRSHGGEHVGKRIGQPDLNVVISDEDQALLQAEAEVVVDFTHPDVVFDNIQWCIDHAMHIVVGTSGITHEQLGEVEYLLDKEGNESNVMVVPNFAMGAVLAQRFSAVAARFFPAVEIIELHHDQKADAPSGTALDTAMRLAKSRSEGYRGPESESLEGSRGGDIDGIRIHSVRLPGLVAHQEVIFGGPGQTLTIRHDSMDRVSFMPGVLLAIKRIHEFPGLTVGLEPLLDLPLAP